MIRNIFLLINKLFSFSRMGVYEMEEELSTPDDASEDSLEEAGVKSVVRKAAATGRKNKRKSQEPRRLNLETAEYKRRRLNSTGSEERSPQNRSRSPSPRPVKSPEQAQASQPPRTSPQNLAPKKRFKLDALRELERLEEEQGSGSGPDGATSKNPFRPWSKQSSMYTPDLPCIPFLLQGLRGEVPLSLLQGLPTSPLPLFPHPAAPLLLHQQPVQEEPLSLVKEKSNPEPNSDSDKKPFHVEKLLESPKKGPKVKLPSVKSVTMKASPKKEISSPDDKMKQRNYKNLTRERRIEANARERQRVHTITAAFDTLQAAIPTDEENIKLSKLSVVKIATAYIMALSRMAGYDYTEDRSAPSVESVLEHCRQTITNETKIKKRS